MYPHVGEAFIRVNGASCLAEKIYRKISKLCQSTNLEGFDTSLDFRDGGAIIQSTNEGLTLHVFASDVLTFYGIRALVEGGLPIAIFRSVESIEWLPEKASPRLSRA